MAKPESSRAPVALVLIAGVVGAFHVGKLPPALPLVREELGLGLVTAGWLVSLMQLAGAALALAGGAIADRVGQRRTMVAGLLLLALGGLAGAFAQGAAALLAARVVESCGLLMTVLPGPALLARMVPPARLRFTMGLWGAYMPAGMAAIMLFCAVALERIGWRVLWIGCAVLAALLALLVARGVRLPTQAAAAAVAARPVGRAATVRLARDVLTSPGPWLLAGCFGFYAAQWMSLFSFLPTLYREEGIGLSTAAVLTAGGVAVNAGGNVAAGWLLQRGATRGALIAIAASTMLVCGWVALGSGAPLPVRFAAVVAFSAVGGLIPGTLFATIPAFAPHPGAVSTTAGLVQQGSSIGQLGAPPLLAAVAASAGGWHLGWMVTGALACCDLLLAIAIARRDRLGRARSNHTGA